MANLRSSLVGADAALPGWYCPHCHVHGTPQSIRIAYGTQMVEFRCPKCRLEWTNTTIVEANDPREPKDR
jgi:hypothetical protein